MTGKNRITGAIGIVIRTHDEPKNPYIPLILRTILGPAYYFVCTPVIVRRGEKSLLCDPGCEVRLGGRRETSRAKIVSGMGKQTKKKKGPSL